MKPRPRRLRAQVDAEYGQLCAEVGHKMRICSQLEDEITRDTLRLKALNQEASLIPPESMADLRSPAAQEQQAVPKVPDKEPQAKTEQMEVPSEAAS